MLLDFSRHPLQVAIEECPASIIVRTAASPDADGIVRRWEEHPRQKKRTIVQLEPVAATKNSAVKVMETRLPFDHIKPSPKGEQTVFLPDPFEVVSFYRDVLSKKPGVWRLNIALECHTMPNFQLWYVTVHDETRGAAVVTLSARDLTSPTAAAFQDLTPLQRYLRAKAHPHSAWDRLLEDDF